MTINNNTGQILSIANIMVTWNSDKGHQTGGDKTLRLINIQLGAQSAAISSGNGGPSYSLSPAWTLPTGRSTFTFTFHQNYDNADGTELITMTFSTTGCGAFTFNSSINSPPLITKTFVPETIEAGATSTLTFTITNPNNFAIGLSGIAYTDTFPSGMTRGKYSCCVTMSGDGDQHTKRDYIVGWVDRC